MCCTFQPYTFVKNTREKKKIQGKLFVVHVLDDVIEIHKSSCISTVIWNGDRSVEEIYYKIYWTIVCVVFQVGICNNKSRFRWSKTKYTPPNLALVQYINIESCHPSMHILTKTVYLLCETLIRQRTQTV